MKNILFVYNPVAGQAKIQKNMFEVVDSLEAMDCAVTLCQIRNLKQRYLFMGSRMPFDRIICSGGDGTLNELMSFLTQNNIHIDVGYLPSGSTNDYAHSLGISLNFNEALEQAVKGKPHAFDVGRFNDRYFMYVAGFGLFTKVSYTTPQRTKNILGHTAYLLEGIKELSDLRKYQVCVDTGDFHIQDEFIIGLVTNSLFVGGFRDILPADSALDDGVFEVLLIREPKSLNDLSDLIVDLTKGALKNNPNVLFIRCNQLRITSTEPMDWTLDGEYGGNPTQTDIQNLHKAFSVVC